MRRRLRLRGACGRSARAAAAADMAATAATVSVRVFRNVTDERGSSYVEYRVKTVSGGASTPVLGPGAAQRRAPGASESGPWEAWRRFSQFERLLGVLGDGGDDVSGVLLPSKLFGTAPEQRKTALEHLLSELLRRLTVGGQLSTAPKPLLDFLGASGLQRSPGAGAGASGAFVPLEAGPDEYRARLDQIGDGVEELVAAIDSGTLEASGWSKVGSSGPFAWYAHHATNRMMACGVVPQCTARMCHDIFFYSVADFKRIEPNLDTVADVRKLGAQTVVQHAVMKSIMWLACRDVIFVRHWRVVPAASRAAGGLEGCVLHLDFTLDEHAGVPLKDTQGRVRAVETFGGTVIRPVRDQPTRTFVCIVTDMDPRVAGAASVQRQVNSFSAKMLSENLANLVEVVKSKDLAAYLALPPLRNVGKGEAAAPAVAAAAPPLSQAPQAADRTQPFIRLVLVLLLLAALERALFIYYNASESD